MAIIKISDLRTDASDLSGITEVNAELCAAINGGLHIEFTIGKKWKHPIHVELGVEVQ